MYTQCPDCWSIYRIAAETLACAHGRVRCGHCGVVFDATTSLSSTLPEDVTRPLARTSEPAAPPVLSIAVSSTSVLRTPEPGAAGTPSSTADEDLATADRAFALERQEPNLLPGEWLGRQLPSPRADPAPAARPSSAASPSSPGLVPSFVAPPRSTRRVEARGHRPVWSVAVALLGVGLLLQLAWLYRQPLLEQPWARAAWQRSCRVLGCAVPLPFLAERWTFLSRQVSPHPEAEGALLISATLRNDAAIAQAFPILEVRLTGLNRSVIAARRFAPAEYLADPTVSAHGVAPGATVPITLEAVDPGASALSFEFDLRAPRS